VQPDPRRPSRVRDEEVVKAIPMTSPAVETAVPTCIRKPVPFTAAAGSDVGGGRA
jgi:hypothetical protein